MPSDSAIPGSFVEWPEEDQVEYLSNTMKKRELVETVLEELSVDANIRPQAQLRKRDWAKVVLAVQEVTDE